MRDGYRSPFFTPTGNGRVVGELIELTNENEALEKLDVFEGPNYVCKKISVATDNGDTVSAWAYVAAWDKLPDDVRIIESGDYSVFSAETASPS